MNPTATRPVVQTSRPVWLGKPRNDKRWDYTCISNQLMDDKRVGRLEMAIYLGLARHANPKTGESWPSAETLAGYARCSRSSVFKAIRSLIELGYLTMKSGHGRQVNHYWIGLPGSVDNSPQPGSDRVALSRDRVNLSRDTRTRRTATERDVNPYVPVNGDTSDDPQPKPRSERRELSDARRKESIQVECPKCGAPKGKPCVGKRRGLNLRRYFHAERGDLAALWATEHLTVTTLVGPCWTCQDDGRVIDDSGVAKPCWDCSGGST